MKSGKRFGQFFLPGIRNIIRFSAENITVVAQQTRLTGLSSLPVHYNMEIDLDEVIYQFAGLHLRKIELANIYPGRMSQKPRIGDFRELKPRKPPRRASVVQDPPRSLCLSRSLRNQSVFILDLCPDSTRFWEQQCRLLCPRRVETLKEQIIIFFWESAHLPLPVVLGEGQVGSAQKCNLN